MSLTQDERPDIAKLAVKPDKLGDVPTWSYSALKVFEECPYRTYISRVKKVREPSGPAAERGTEIHQQAEDFVSGKLGELPDTLKKFEDEFHELRTLFNDAKVELEGEWGFDLDWNPVGWVEQATWARIKLDALVHEDETSARVIDYKTGKKWGNEITHSQQCLLYAIGTFFRYPHLQFVKTELWYLDKSETTIKTFTREQAMNFAPGFYNRAIAMTTCTDFAPTPSKSACKWCSFRKGDEPECTWGVE
jgi:CRISPR/Cas system-associated exonuclease Cas4 (RecB family)